MSQYNKNLEILKSFFRKPLTLVISILFYSFAVISCIYTFASGVSYPILIAVYFLLALLPAGAFLSLFIQGRKSTEINQLNAPLILIYIYTALSVFAPPAFFIYLLLTGNNHDKWFAFALAVLCVIFLLAFVMLFLNFISMIITFHSIRKSANGIYLSKKGSVFMGVTSFSFVAAVIISVIYTIITTNYLSYADYNNIFIFDRVMIALEVAVIFALFICLGIWSLIYMNTIKKASISLYVPIKKADITVSPRVSNQNPTQNNYSHIRNQAVNNTAPQNNYRNSNNDSGQRDMFAMPKLNEPNPYAKRREVKKTNQNAPTSEDNHINFQNPYKDFIPQNPFDDK